MPRVYKKTNGSPISRKDREFNHKCFVSWFISQVFNCDNTGVLFSDIKSKAPSTSNTIIHLARFMLRNFNVEIFSLNRKYYVSNEKNLFKNQPPSGCKKIKTSLDIDTIKCMSCDISEFVNKYQPVSVSSPDVSSPDVSSPDVSSPDDFGMSGLFGMPDLDSTIFGTPISNVGKFNTPLDFSNQPNIESKTIPFSFDTPLTTFSFDTPLTTFSFDTPLTTFSFDTPPTTMSFDTLFTPFTPPFTPPFTLFTPNEVSISNFLESVDDLFEPIVDSQVKIDDKYLEWLFDM
jgi:hypothetical protein